MSVWKRLQRVGKKAAKFDFTVSYHELTVDCSSEKWIPHKLAVNWTRRSRCIRTKHLDWIASSESGSTKGYVDWRLPENVRGVITLYHDASSPQFDDKEWTFVVEKHEKGGRFKAIASQKVNMREYVSLGGAPKRVKLAMKSNSDKYSNVVLVISISSALIKEGMATDEDMQSIASLMSAGPSDVGNMADFDDELPDGGEDGCAAGHHADNAADDSIIRADTMSQLTALTAEISKFALPEGPSYGARDEHFSLDTQLSRDAHTAAAAPAIESRLKHASSVAFGSAGSSSSQAAKLLLPAHGALLQSHSAATLTSAGRREGTAAAREAQPLTGTTPVQACAATVLPAATSTFVERPFYAGTPPSTPPEERKAAVTAVQPRAITPPPASMHDGHRVSGTPSTTNAESASSASAVRINPSEDLLNWAKSVTSHYKNIIVTNFTTSWRNGLAFCAIIHHFRPDLVDYGSLVQADVRGNNKLAFDTGALLGIDKILEPSDMMALKVPDKLQVMTYIHAMRSRLDAASAQPHDEGALDESTSEQQGASADLAAPSYVRASLLVEEVDSDLDAAIACQVYGEDLVRQRSLSTPKPSSPPADPSAVGQPEPVASAVAKDAALQSASASVRIAGAAPVPAVLSSSALPVSARLSPTDGSSARAAAPHAPVETSAAAKLPPPKEAVRAAVTHQSVAKQHPKQPLMTRKQLLNPFDSDDDDEGLVTPSLTPTAAAAVGLAHATPTTSERGVTGSAPVAAAAQQPPAAAAAAEAAPGKLTGLAGQSKSRQDELKERARQLIERARQDAGAVCAGSQGQSLGAPGSGSDSQVDTRQRVRERARLLLEQMSAECSSTSAAAATAATNAVPAGLVPTGTSALQPAVTARGSYVKEKGYQFYQFSRKEPPPVDIAAAAAHTVSSALTSEHPSASAAVNAARARPPEAVVGRVAGVTQGSAALNRPCLSSALTDAAARLKDGAPTTVLGRTNNTILQSEPKGSTLSVDDFLDASEYVSEELSALEKEQERLDGRASKLEVALRRAMDNGDEEHEEKLTRQWFRLVNRKHELIRRQAELNIINKEHDLERRYELLNRELRLSMALEDWQKSQSQRHREALLLAELVTVVDKRDELVRAMEEQQNALESDQELEKAVHALPIPKEKPCCLQ